MSSVQDGRPQIPRQIVDVMCNPAPNRTRGSGLRFSVSRNQVDHETGFLALVDGHGAGPVMLKARAQAEAEHSQDIYFG
jgi:hypothetical protein